jgi:hypothetical protein
MRHLLSILCLSVALHAREIKLNSFVTADSTSEHNFWTIENKLNTGILAGLVAADAISTQRGLNQGLHEVNPAMRPFVTRGATGEAAGSALGFGAGIGFVYLLHRSHHYKAERIAMRLMVSGEGGFVANNIVAIRRTK